MLKLPRTLQALETLAQCSSPQFRENSFLSAALERLSEIDDLRRADVPSLSRVLELLKATKESAVNDKVIERECRATNHIIDEWQEILSIITDPQHRLYNPEFAKELSAQYGAAFDDLEKLTKQLATSHQKTPDNLDEFAATRTLLGAVSEVALPQAADFLRLVKAELAVYEKEVRRAEELQIISSLLDGPALKLECKFLNCFGDRKYGSSGHPRVAGAFYAVADGRVWRVDFSIATAEQEKPWPKSYHPGEERHLSGFAELKEMLLPWLGRGLQSEDCTNLTRVRNEDLPHELLIKALLES
jgi:hypothetical protein